MQTNLKALALAAAVLTTSLVAPLAANASTVNPATGKAEATFTVNTFRAAKSTNLRVFIQKDNQAAVRVTLKNEAGEVFYETTLGKNQPGKALSLDLSQLPDGHYVVEVSNRDKKEVKSFTLATPTRTLAAK